MTARGSQVLLAISALSLVVTLAMQWAPPLLQMPPGTQIRCAEPVWSAGNVFSGQEVACQFVIENTGRTAVTVKKLSTSCGCTSIAAEIEGQQIPLGKSLTIPVTWTPSSQTGHQTKRVTVEFAEWNNWSLSLQVEGEVLPMWTVNPSQISLGNMTADASVEQVAEITFATGSPVQSATRVQCSHKQIRATLEPFGPNQQRIRVQTLPPLDSGRLSTNLYVHTASDAIVIPVVGFVGEPSNAEIPLDVAAP